MTRCLVITVLQGMTLLHIVRVQSLLNVTIQGLVGGANLWFGGWFGGFPYPINPGRPEWSKVQTRGKPLVATAQAKYVSAGE